MDSKGGLVMGGLDVLSLMLGKEIEKQSGGGGGTTNYGDLENKPQINGVTLNGDKSLEDLGIPSDLADLSDIGIENPTDGQIMKYNESTGKWENYDGPSGCIKLGKVEAFFSESAPAGYLICDGTVYNKSDYPLLAAHLLSLTTHSQYEVDGDDTKFKVPDLRGEFLRGTGTNGHTNQGSGAGVGVHQNASEVPRFYVDSNSVQFLTYGSSARMLDDGDVPSGTPEKSWAKLTLSNSGGSLPSTQRTRPTNTSVLFCIAYCDIYVEDRHTYSTNEHIVGTWIDGKPIYEKTFTETFATNITDGTFKDKVIDDTDIPIDVLVDLHGSLDIGNGGKLILHTVALTNTGHQAKLTQLVDGIHMSSNHADYSGKTCTITIQYTKTTDSVNL